MARTPRCPKCGSTHVQLSNVERSHGFLWFILFGWIYLIVLPIKWSIGLALLVCIDWWMAMLKASQNKGYVWKCARWFTGKKNTYYCHEFHYNFKG